MNRRNFIRTTGVAMASALISDNIVSSTYVPVTQLINLPDEASAIINNQSVNLQMSKGGELWTY